MSEKRQPMNPGIIRVFVDGKENSAFNGDIDEWRHKEQLRFPRLGENDIVSVLLSEPKHIPPLKETALNIKARDEGISKNYELYLHLFVYQYTDPTTPELYNHIINTRMKYLDIT